MKRLGGLGGLGGDEGITGLQDYRMIGFKG